MASRHSTAVPGPMAQMCTKMSATANRIWQKCRNTTSGLIFHNPFRGEQAHNKTHIPSKPVGVPLLGETGSHCIRNSSRCGSALLAGRQYTHIFLLNFIDNKIFQLQLRSMPDQKIKHVSWAGVAVAFSVSCCVSFRNYLNGGRLSYLITSI